MAWMIRNSERVRRVARGSVRLMRATATGMLLMGIFMALSFRSARVSAQEQTLRLGRELGRFADVLKGSHEVSINGERMFVASAVSQQSVGEVLDRFESHCREYSGGIEEDLERMMSMKKSNMTAQQISVLQKLAVIRTQADEDGTLICLAQRGHDGFAGAVARITEVLRTGDLGKLGDLRYVYVKRTKEGLSHVLTSYTEGSFNLHGVFPADGSESKGGEDPPGVPRPGDAHRLASLKVKDEPAAAQVYQSKMAPEELVKFYEAELPSSGWKPLMGIGQPLQAWQKEGVTLIWSCAKGLLVDGTNGRGTTVHFIEQGVIRRAPPSD